jgi:hypothetical protein
VALIALVTSAVAGWDQGLFFLLETAPLCIGIRWAALSSAPLFRSVAIAVGLVVFTALLSVMAYSLTTGHGLTEIYNETFQRMGLVMDSVPNPAGLGEQEIQQLHWMMDLWRKLFTGIWVSTLIFLVTFYTLLIRGWMTAAGLIETEKLEPLSAWRLPFPFVLAFILVASAVLFSQGTPRFAALNLLLPLGTLYGVQGVIVAGHMFTRWALPPFVRALFLAFGIITFPMVFMICIALVGLFDTWIDFRRRWPTPEAPEPPKT